MPKRVPNLAEFDTLLPESLQGKVKLTDKVQWVKPDSLRPNPRNQELFDNESVEYFSRLRDDVQQRGIVVPLVAKEDGTLLSGHNRLLIAQELALKIVPVQYVQNDLSAEQEQEFIIKDNLYRRQLSQLERIALYKKLFPTFEETFLQPQMEVKTGRTSKGDSRLTLKTIADTTGQKLSAVKMQVTRARGEQAKKNGHNVTKNATRNVTKKTEAKTSTNNNGHNVTVSPSPLSEQEYQGLVRAIKEVETFLKKDNIAEAKKCLRQILQVHTSGGFQ
jgi:ParB-like chromosome segregation protein Spo0J